jgi:hypothetical protein
MALFISGPPNTKASSMIAQVINGIAKKRRSEASVRKCCHPEDPPVGFKVPPLIDFVCIVCLIVA